MQPENNPPHPSYRTLILVSCIVGMGCYTGAYMRIPVLPLFARSLGAAAVEIGLINSCFMLAASLFAIPLGIVSDRIGRKPVAMAGLLMLALSSFLLGLSRTPAQMMIIYVFAGVGISAFGPTMMSFVADFSPATHLGRSYGFYTMAIYGGMTLGPAIGGSLAHMFGYQRVFTISAILCFIMLLIVMLTFPARRSPRSRNLQKDETIKKIHALLKNRRLLACWLVTLFSCFGLGVFITFLPLHANDHGIGAGQIGLIFATQAIVNALGRIPFGYLSDWVSDRSNLVLAGLLGYSISIAGMGLSTSPAMFFASAFVMGISMGIAFTALGAMISEMVPVDFRGMAMGGYNTCIYIGMMLSGLVMGVVAHHFGFHTCFLITACVNAAGAFAFILVFKSVPVGNKGLSVNRPFGDRAGF
jgi:MFS family permease